MKYEINHADKTIVRTARSKMEAALIGHAVFNDSVVDRGLKTWAEDEDEQTWFVAERDNDISYTYWIYELPEDTNGDSEKEKI